MVGGNTLEYALTNKILIIGNIKFVLKSDPIKKSGTKIKNAS